MEGLLRLAKKIPLIRRLSKLRLLSAAYHFLWAWWAAAWFRFPSRNVFVVGVTGTKGKSTTLEYINAILEAAGHTTALLSSVRIKIGSQTTKNLIGNSMPGRGYIQGFLRRAVQTGCAYALVEVTSEGAKHFRHHGIGWKAAALTNISPEHIESHGSFEKYQKAKLAFLQYAAAHGARVFINDVDQHKAFFMERLPPEMVYAYSEKDVPKLDYKKNNLRGFLEDFNQENIAAAASIARALGIKEEAIASAIRHFNGVPGRMEFVQEKPFAVIVDYAHTPDSLEKVYHSLKERSSGKLICVLGSCGGGRDKWKRPKMGEVAGRYCDEIIFTNEDPYDEPPKDILDQLADGLKGRPHHKILDRREAIRQALSLAAEGDTVIMTGKGSESWIHVDHGKKVPWDEKTVARELLVELSS